MVFGGDTADSYYDEGVTAAMRGDVEQAIQHFNRTITLDDSYLAAYHQLGRCYTRLGKLQDAIDLFVRVIKEKPHQIPIRIDLGNALMEMGKFREARQVFDEVLQVKPANQRAQLGLAHCAFNQGQWEESMQLAQAATLMGQPLFSTLYLLGRAALMGGHHVIAEQALGEAMRQVDQMVETSPEHPEGYYLRGEILMMHHKYAEARDALDAAENRAKPHVQYSAYGEHFSLLDILNRLGVCYGHLGANEKAAAIGQRILILDPENKGGKKLAGKFEDSKTVEENESS